jgi:4-amino-4-deoxy-L-arabinose transferase-like glycosyltransferase
MPRDAGTAATEPAWPFRASPVVVIAAVALLLRGIAWLRTGVLFNDGPIFIGLARLYSEGEFSAALSHDFHPLYSLAIAAVHALGPGWEQAAAGISILSGAAATICLYVFLRDGFDSRVAWIGALLLAVHPYALNFSSDVQSDGLYLALFLGAVAALWRGLRDGRPSLAALAGALSGLAYLTRPEGLGVTLVGVGMVVLLVLRGRFRPVRGLAFAGALVATTLAVMSPYLIALREQTGDWRLTQKKSVSAVIGMEGIPRSRRGPVAIPGERAPRVWTPPAPRAERPPSPQHDPTAEREGRAREVWHALAPGFRYENMVFLGIGVFARRRRLGWVDVFIASLLALYALVIGTLVFQWGYVSRRHMVPPLVPAFAYVAIGVPIFGGALVRLAQRALRRGGAPSAFAAVTTGVALVLALTLPKDLGARRMNRVAERRAAEWLREQPGRAGPVAAWRRRVSYYADALHVPLRTAPLGELVHYLRKSGARHMVIDERTLVKLTGSTGDDPGLRRLHAEESAGRRAFVFEVLPRASDE